MGIEEKKEKNFDVVVIGAGYAGLAAMQKLIELKVNALLCEGRNGFGGRTIQSKKKSQNLESSTSSGPAIAERGAFFVYTNEMKQRLENIGVEVVEFPHDGFYTVSEDKKIIPAGPDGGPVGHARVIAKEIMGCEKNISYQEFFKTSKTYQALSKNDKKAVYTLFEADLAGPLDEVGISSAIHDAQTVGDNSNDFFGICTKGGLSTLAESMAENIPSDSRRTNTLIQNIRLNNDGGLDFELRESAGKKTPSKEALHAQSGILTVPITAIDSITYTDKDGATQPLKQIMRPEVQQALDMIGSGDVVKIGLKIRKQLVEGKRMVHCSFPPPDNGPIRCASVRALPLSQYGDTASKEEGQMILMYLGGTQARDFRKFCRDLDVDENGEKLQKIKEVAIAYLMENLSIDPSIFTEDQIDISGWHGDQGNRTAYSYIKANGGPVTYNPRAAFKGSVLPEDMPPLYLAGEAYSESGATLTTGAIDSGTLAAETIQKQTKQ